ncbi:MAG: hypothetical protein WCL32_24500 [Planctomycetota bacterium]
MQGADCGPAPGKTCIVLVKRFANGDNRASSGKILLQSEGFELDFRRFELMPLGKK